MADLLLHSLAELREVVFGVAEALQPRRMVEIGVGGGAFTAELSAWCARRGTKLASIDPSPPQHVRSLAAASRGMHELVTERSPAALERIAAAELYLIDGDHNYYTVTGELEQIHRACAGSAVALLHDVCWPWGRRDLYYSPTELPLEHVHPHTYELGVDLDSNASVQGGFRGEGAYAMATHEGGPRNGVLTAVEDFVARHPGLQLRVVPAVFGLGVLFGDGHPQRGALEEVLRLYDRNPLIARLEENRLRNYLRVLALQDELNAARGEHHRLAAQLERLKRRWYHRVGEFIDSVLRRPA